MGTTHTQGEGTPQSQEHEEAEIIRATWKSVHFVYYTDQEREKKKKTQRVHNTSFLSQSQVEDLELEAKFKALQDPWSHP